MADTLTESFCERCGTRYEFTAPTRLNPLRKTRGLFGGLRNYLTSQDALSDAIGDAMRDEEGALATAQLDAFHSSFNFCIDCRQYTCVNCWNDDDGRCRSCAPVAGTDDLGDRLAASFAQGPATAALPELPLQPDPREAMAWPTSDLPLGIPTNGHVPTPEPWPTAAIEEPPAEAPERFVGADGFVYETQAQADAASAAPPPVEPTYAPWAGDAPTEPVAAEAAPEPATARLHVVAWDADGAYDVEIDAAPAFAEAEPFVAEVEPEPFVAEVEPEPFVAEVEPEPFVAEVEPEPFVAEVEPEPFVAEVEPEREPTIAEAPPEPSVPHRIAPISETILHFPERPAPVEPEPAEVHPVAAQDDSPELAARRAQLDLLGLGDPGEGPVQEPTVLPYRSRGAAISQAELAARAAQGASFWEASAREVASAVGNVGVQNCGHCGLSLSATARFCRRCGTRQAQPA